MVRVLLLLTISSAALSVAQMNKVILPDGIVTGLGARCMDGTRGGYYVQPSKTTNATKYRTVL